MDDNKGGFVSNTIAWMTHPFNSEGSALNWWLFVGLIVIAAWMWSVIIADVQRAV